MEVNMDGDMEAGVRKGFMKGFEGTEAKLP